MIDSKAKYLELKKFLELAEEHIRREEARLRFVGFSPDSISRALEPSISYLESIKEDLELLETVTDFSNFE